jgi:hypothetical protein
MRNVSIWLAVVSVTVVSLHSHAADTTETFGIGASDFELYLGFDGAGLGKYEKTVSAAALVGFGFMDRFSGYVTAFAEGNEYFSEGGGGAGFGIFGTPVDTNHFDLDLFLDSGFGEGEMHIAPAVELNLDAKPDLGLCGLYLRAAEVLEGRDDSVEDDPATDTDETHEKHTFAPTTSLTVGAYVTIAEIHQILVEYDVGFHHGLNDAPEGKPKVVEHGGVALGYNVVVSEHFEIISQVSVDIPNDGEKVAAGFMVGMIASMSSPAP